ncbi:MAG TPA: hypothetical protein VE075_06695 [Thermoanaerobaculia bacterium]|nr:hypothetical protein [Thermoanaerobaculia bacterium]
MGKKVLLGGLVGSVIVFLVSAAWHMTPGLGEIGVKGLPAEDSVLAGLRASVREPGLYFFPAPNMSANRTKEQVKADEAAYLERYRQGPSGILVYQPGGEGLNFGKLLVYQYLLGLVASFLIAWILALTAAATTYGARVLLVLLITLFGAFIYDLPAWNWYGFPMSYTIAHSASWLVSWGVAALAMARIVAIDRRTAS